MVFQIVYSGSSSGDAQSQSYQSYAHLFKTDQKYEINSHKKQQIGTLTIKFITSTKPQVPSRQEKWITEHEFFTSEEK